MKTLLSIFVLLFSCISFSQNIIINYNTRQGNIQGFYYKTDNIGFFISETGNLEYIILGNVDKNTNLQLCATIKDTKIFAENLTEINYATEYTIPKEFTSLPININNNLITYNTNYYDNEFIKGKIKSIGNIAITYYSDYYLDATIKGKIKSIGSLRIDYSDDYVRKDIQGKFIKIGDIKIDYIKSYTKDYLNSKIESIGNSTFEYFDDYFNTSHNGEFKKINHIDNRFKIVTDY